MKNIKILFALTVMSMTLLPSCEDDSLKPGVEPQAGAYAKGQFINSADGAVIPGDFDSYSQSAVDGKIFWSQNTLATSNVKGQVTWNAGKEQVQISKIEIYVQLTESYVDKNNNVTSVAHGPASSPTVPEGKLLQTLDATGRLVPVAFNVTPSDVYNLYKGTKFDYLGNGTSVDIFENNPFVSRTTNRFLAKRKDPASGKDLASDNIRIKWRLIATDSRAFGSFGNNVCSQLVDANCFVQFIVK